MNPDEVALYRDLLVGTALDGNLTAFSTTLGTATQPAGGLYLVGTPDDEPWHFAAHLTDEAEWAARPELSPTLVRWQVPDNAPAHLSVGIHRLSAVGKRETLLVVAPDATPDPMLERLSDARKAGALLLAIDTGDRELQGLAHESLTVPRETGGSMLDVVQHVVSQTAPLAVRLGAKGLRARMAEFLDRLQGAPTDHKGAWR